MQGIFMRHGEGVQRWPDGRIYAGQWEQHLYHGEGALWRDEDGYVLGLEHAIYRGQWCKGKRHGHGIFRFIQPSQWSRPREKLYEGQFELDVFSGRGRLTAEPPPEGEIPPKEKQRTIRGGIPAPRLEVEELLEFDGFFRMDLDEAYDEVQKAYPDWLDRHPFARQVVRLEGIAENERQANSARFRYFFGARDEGFQQYEGMPLPDLAMAYYTLPGRDTDGIDGSGCMYFTDDSIYQGEFQDGLPERAGELVQRSRARSQSRLEEVARYRGQWLRGKRQGQGWYRTRRDIVYDGEWHDDEQHGQGEQTVPLVLATSFGYTKYKGQWQRGSQDGFGAAYLEGFGQRTMILPGNEGIGFKKASTVIAMDSMVPVSKDVLLYQGDWSRGAIHAPESRPAWAHLVDRATGIGRYYFGSLCPNGSRSSSIGFLYESDVALDEGFREALSRGEAFIEAPTVLDALRGDVPELEATQDLHYTCYVGPWVDDLPHGQGIQAFRRLGVYVGQFSNGQRSGCGTWIAADGSLRYRPQDTSAKTWEADAMHGTFVVEEGGRVHEGVTYYKDVCRTWRPGLREVQAIAKPACPDSNFSDPIILRSMSAEALASQRKLDMRRSRGQFIFVHNAGEDGEE